MVKLIVDHGSSRLGNQMMRYLNALSMKKKFSEFEIFSYDIREWGIEKPIKVGFPFIPLLLRGQCCPLEFAMTLVRHGVINSIQLAAIRMDLDWFLPVDDARRVFPAPTEIDAAGFDERHLVINIRGSEILSGKHKHYGPLPFTYYDKLILETNTIPVFMGQIGDDYFGAILRDRYPNAIMMPSRGAIEDFHVIRNSKNIVLSISTFSWMAAWLSQADRIFMPVVGLFDPRQRPDIVLTPLDDDRFVYDLFPIRHWRGTPGQIAELKTTTNFRRLDRSELATMLRRAKWRSLPQRVRKHLQLLGYLALHLLGRLMR